MEIDSQKKLELRYAARIMQRFSGIYGAGVVRRKFSEIQGGEDVGMAAAIEALAIELYPLRDRLDLIKYGVENVNAEFPEFIPTPYQFHQLCLRGKRKEFKPEPDFAPASRDAVAKAKKEAQKLAAKANRGNKEWAEKLRKDFKAGKGLLEQQITMASKALREKWTKVNGVPVIESLFCANQVGLVGYDE